MTAAPRGLPVHAELAAYRTAIAELPNAVHATDERAGSIAVVAGDGWPARVRSACGSGAIAVIVDEPAGIATDPADAGERFLAEDFAGASVPIVIVRRRMPALPDPRHPLAFVTVEGSGPDLLPLLRDGLGMARRLVGALQVEHVRRTEHAVSAVLTAGDGRSVAVTATRAPAPEGADWLRVRGHGAEAIEAMVDTAAGTRRVIIEDGDGVRSLPAGHESPEREAVRAAVTAVAEPRAPRADLVDARLDLALVSAILRPRQS